MNDPGIPTGRSGCPGQAGRAGFSLVEILVATTILAFLVVFLGMVLRQMGVAWMSGEARTRNRENGRTIAEFIGRELKGALPPIDSGSKGLQLVLNPSAIPTTCKNRDALFWQAPLATNRSYGDIAAIGYFVRWDTSTPNRPKALLCRFFVNPAVPDPDHEGQSLPNPRFRIYDQPETWLSGAILDDVAPGDKANDYRGLFAENVLGLWVTCLDRNGAVISGASSGGSFDSRTGYKGSGNIQYYLPAMVEISFVIVDSRAAGRIDSALQAVIAGQVRQASSAAEFVSLASGNGQMIPIRTGLRAYSKKINLLNSR